MIFNKLSKYVCCTIDLTIACRIIGFIGVSISVLLITVLLNDKYYQKSNNYDVSRRTALALGLDWQHFHPQASTAHEVDPEGKMISIIVIFYSTAFLAINFLLLFATIKHDWRYTVPWLICEWLGCLSKFGALIFHWFTDPQSLSTTFIIGSIVYIVTMVWWWIVVFLAQSSWKCRNKSSFPLEMSVMSALDSEESRYPDRSLSGKIRFTGAFEKLESPLPYCPNAMYSLI